MLVEVAPGIILAPGTYFQFDIFGIYMLWHCYLGDDVSPQK
jgi:hypothetical protein